MIKANNEMTFQEVIDDLKFLNPKADIKLSSYYGGIVSNRPAEKLWLPRDFYVTKNGSISNLGHTESGNFLTISVAVKKNELNQQPKLRFLNQAFKKMFACKEQAPNEISTDREM